MQTTIKLDDEIDLTNYTVLFPSVCVGNTAQLAIDLIISTLQMRRIATIWHPAIIPILGPRAFEHPVDVSSVGNNITTACELFVSESQKILCFQLRAPLVPDQMTSFFNQLIQFLQEQKIQQFIVLTGSFAHEQHAIGSTKFRYLADKCFKALHKDQFDASGWLEWDETNRVIHGGGYAISLWKAIVDANADFAACLFFKYISEGDNRPDAGELVQQLNALLSNGLLTENCERLIAPVSWQALFGNAPTEQLY